MKELGISQSESQEGQSVLGKAYMPSSCDGWFLRLRCEGPVSDRWGLELPEILICGCKANSTLRKKTFLPSRINWRQRS